MIGGLACAILSTVIQVVSTLSNAGMGMQASPVGIILGCLGCLVGLTSGLIAVWHYTGEHELTLTGGQGVKLGALAGVVSALAAFLLTRALVLMDVMPSADDMLNLLMENPAFDNPDANMDMVEWWIEFSMGWGGLLVGLIFGPLFGLAGGAIGAAMFKRGDTEIIMDLPDEA